MGRPTLPTRNVRKCTHTHTHTAQPDKVKYGQSYRKRTNFAHDTASAAGERGEGPAARLELSGSSCQLAAPRASSPPSSNAVARGRDSLAPRAEPRADLSSALAQQRVACAVEEAVILLCREREDVDHAGTPQSPRRC
eukprot:scaffold22465_cov60-Phaeocystis_antarctica.AAC.4